MEINPLGGRTIILDEVDSTNTYVKTNITSLLNGDIIVAKHQTGGRGRMGNSWADFGEKNLTFSFLETNCNINKISILPLICGLGTVNALNKLVGQRSFGVKWPNDVIYNLSGDHYGKKVCGILCESVIYYDKVSAVCGLGINVAQEQADFDHVQLPYAASLKMLTGYDFEPMVVLDTVAQSLTPLLEQYMTSGFSPLRADYCNICVTLSKEVEITIGGQSHNGIAVDISEDGNLVCSIDGTLVKVNASEAHVRGLYGYV